MKHTKLSKLLKKWNSVIVGALLLLAGMGLAVPGDGGGDGGAGDQGGDQGAGGAQGAGDQGGAQGGDQGGGDGGGDPTPEELAAAEEARRAALSPEERAAEDQAKADAEKGKEGAPEEYADFKVPEHMEMDPAVLAEFKPFLKDELNLSQDKAQKLVDFYTSKVIPSFAAKGQAVWQADLDKRAGEIVADAEIGGEKLTATKEAVNRVANTFLNAEESKELTEYSARFGDCRAFLKILTRISGSIAEGKIIMPGAGGDKSSASLADRLYGGSEK